MSALTDEMLRCAKNFITEYSTNGSFDVNMAALEQARKEIAARESLLQEVLDWHDQPEDKQPREWAQIVREIRAAMGGGA